MADLWLILTWLSGFIALYHYVGYPLWLWWRATRPEPPAPFYPTVSLIIAAYNEAAVMVAKLENSLALVYPAGKLEILVVSDGSDDETPAIVQRYAARGVQQLHQPQRQGKSPAMNRAAGRATGQILLFSDANAFYEPQAVQRLVSHFVDERVGGVSGNKQIEAGPAGVSRSAGLYWRYESAIKEWESNNGSTVAVVGEMLAVRRDLFQPIPAGIINDDAYLAVQLLQQGYRVLYEPSAVCWEKMSEAIADEVVRRRRINAGRYQLLFRPQDWAGLPLPILVALFSHKFLRLFMPFVLLIGLVSNGVAAWRNRGGRLIRLGLVGQMLLLGLGLLGALGKGGKPASLAYYFWGGQWAVLQGLGRYLSGRQTVLWQKTRRSEE